jgi:preprotein translocase subunit SecG
MQNVLLIVHLLLALSIVGIVLLQRSEGGGLGMGGGGGGATTGRGAATALSKVTWFLGFAFIATSLTLTILAAREAATSSVMDLPGALAPDGDGDDAEPAPPPPFGGDLLPPSAGDAPLAPPPAD